MRFSVVVPTRNNPQNLEKCISNLKRKKKKVSEIIIVSPMRDAAKKIARKYSCRWAEDKANTIGNAYNVGSVAARNEVVAFTDDDCVVSEDWLNRLEGAIKDTDVVGGDDVIDEKRSTDFQNAVFAIDKARAGGTLHGRDAARRIRACNMAIRHEVLKKHNFDTELTGLQEPELLHRLYKEGYRIKFDPSIKVMHTRRSDLSGVFNQIYRNGIAKTDLIRRHGEMISFFDVLMPAAFLVTIVLLLASLALFMWWIALLAAYFLLKPLYILLKTGRLRYYPLLLQIIFVREFAYGLGLIRGAIRKNI